MRNVATRLFTEPKIKLGIFYLLIFTQFFSKSYSNIFIFSLSILAIGYLVITKTPVIERIKYNKFYLTCYLYYFLHIVFLISTSDLQKGVSMLERSLSFIVFPLIFISLNLTKKDIINLLEVFVISATGATLFSVFFRLTSLIKKGVELSISHFYRDEITEILNTHPSYFAYYVSTAILISFYFIYQKHRTWIYFIQLSWLLFVLILSGSRMPIIGFVIVSVIPIYKIIKAQKPWLVILCTSLVVIAIIIVSSNKSIYSRFSEIQETEIAPPMGIHHNSTNLRVGIFLCTMETLKSNWFWGVGTGDIQIELNNCYASKPWSDVLYKDNYNTHNQLLQTMLGMGLLGVCCLLAMYYILVKEGYDTKNFTLIAFALFFLFCSLTEALFCRQKGIVLFMMMVPLLMQLPYRIKDYIPKN